MNKNIENVIVEVSRTFNHEIDKTIGILLKKAKVKNTDNRKDIQVNLIENGYDLIQYNFKSDPFKTLVALTDIGGKFIKGYLIKFDIENQIINKKLIKYKSQFEQIIKEK